MYGTIEWLSDAIQMTGLFIFWVFLLLVAIGVIALAIVVIEAVAKTAIDGIKSGGKKRNE